MKPLDVSTLALVAILALLLALLALQLYERPGRQGSQDLLDPGQRPEGNTDRRPVTGR